ncbi:aminopeptidase P family N-terminal domain-containing protein, partial [Streptococcus penaeicida]
MTKITQIQEFLKKNEAELAVFSDPITVNYLTGFACDPHERQMFLFIYD